MVPDPRLMSERFPRASAYSPEWLLAGVSGAAHPLWMTEWLCEALELRRGMRVLDLGCGRALSSIFLHREFGVQVWAADLWFSASENLQRIRDAGAGEGVFPLHADARDLPFAADFFDAIVSIDSFVYYGTDELYLNALARFLKPGGMIGIAGAGLMREIDGAVPAHLSPWWTADHWILHSASWWRRHWERSGILDITTADALPDGWRRWREWLSVVAPENLAEAQVLEADAGRHLGYVRVAGRRRSGISLTEPIASVPTQYARKDLLRGPR